MDHVTYPEDGEYEEGEEHYYDDDGAFGVGLPPSTDTRDADGEW